jgi:hypothetical protein
MTVAFSYSCTIYPMVISDAVQEPAPHARPEAAHRW